MLSDSEKLDAIRQIVKEYIEDEDHWSDFFMEKVCDVVWDRGASHESG